MRKILLLAFLLLPFVTEAQTFLSVNDLLNVRTSFLNHNKDWVQILRDRGYNKTQEIHGDQYAYKNCRLTILDDDPYRSDGQVVEADTKTADASIVRFYEDEFRMTTYFHIEVIVYGKSNAQKWIQQIKALGYKSNNSAGSSGNGRNDWYYTKRGFPELHLMNKGTMFKLDVYIQGSGN